MSTIKAAVTIEESVFKRVDAFAKERHLSRSEVFTAAAADYLERQKTLEIKEQLNAVYGVDAKKGDLSFQKAAFKKSGRVVDPW